MNDVPLLALNRSNRASRLGAPRLPVVFNQDDATATAAPGAPPAAASSPALPVGRARAATAAPGIYNQPPQTIVNGVTPGGLDESRIDSAGTPLPVGTALRGGPPGLAFSKHDTPLLNDPVAAAVDPGSGPEYGFGAGKPPPSMFTLTGASRTNAPATGAPGATPASAAQNFRLASTNLALQRILTTPPGGTAPGAGPVPNAAGAAPPLIAAAGALRDTQMNLAANDEASRLAPYVPTADQPAGYRNSNALYLQKMITDNAASDPTLRGANGAAPSVDAMAATAHRLMGEAGQPRLVQLGKDSSGRPVEGTIDRSGNFSRIAEPANKAKPGEPQYSGDGKFFRSSETDEWKPVPGAHEAPLSISAWVMSGQKLTDYKSYRDNFDKVVKSLAPAGAAAAPGAAQPAAAAKAAPAAAPVYRHEEVQAELRKRGLIK